MRILSESDEGFSTDEVKSLYNFGQSPALYRLNMAKCFLVACSLI